MKSCPFCGDDRAPRQISSNDDLMQPVEGGETFAICCDINNGGCGASGGYRPSPEDALKVWECRA